MRVLFVLYSERTHFFSMVPLAWALRTAGHEVRVASQPELTGDVVATGLTSVPVGRNHQLWRVLRAHGKEYRGRLAPFDLAATPNAEVTWDYLRDGYADVVPWWLRLVNDSMVEDLTAFCRWWRPDLVVWEPTTYAGAIAAEACGAAHARLTWGVDFHGAARKHYVRLRDEVPGREDPLRDWMSRWSGSFGFPYREHMAQGHFTIDQLPESFRLPTGLDCLGMRYVPFNGPAVVPEWLRTTPERPRVALTLGLSAVERLAGYSVSVGDVLRSLGALDVEVVATVASSQQRDLPELPDNVRVVEFVPLNDLLPTCSAVVHHGGFGTAATATAAGVPQVVLPQQFDTSLTSARLAQRGAALVLDTEHTDREQVGATVDRLLSEEGFAHQAALLREEIEAMPSPNDIVPEIERRTESVAGPPRRSVPDRARPGRVRSTGE